jgi:hypothetical protein
MTCRLLRKRRRQAGETATSCLGTRVVGRRDFRMEKLGPQYEPSIVEVSTLGTFELTYLTSPCRVGPHAVEGFVPRSLSYDHELAPFCHFQGGRSVCQDRRSGLVVSRICQWNKCLRPKPSSRSTHWNRETGLPCNTRRSEL